jgi:hypothetical protein
LKKGKRQKDFVDSLERPKTAICAVLPEVAAACSEHSRTRKLISRKPKNRLPAEYRASRIQNRVSTHQLTISQINQLTIFFVNFVPFCG